MPSMKDPSPEAVANVTEENVETRSQLLPGGAGGRRATSTLRRAISTRRSRPR